MDIREIIKKGESENLEFKKSWSEKDDIMKTICAFLNKNGGTIVIGVDDNGRILGIDVGKGTIEEIANEIRKSIIPPIFPSVEVVNIDSKKIIVIRVEEGFNKPYFYKGRAYVRVGKTNQIMSPDELRKLLRKEIHYEKKPVKFEIDERTVEYFVNLTRNKRNMEIIYENYEDVLEKLGVRENVAGLLCFGKNPQKEIPYAEIQIGIFKNESLTKFWNISGNLFNQVEKTLEIISMILKQGYSIDEKGIRKEVWEIPYEAIREAVVNAVVHRDYSIPSPTNIKIYEDRVIVENPGTLPEPLKPEDLKREHRSIPRNPLIARVFFLAGYIERWGTGTNKMVRLCIENGLREPDFIEDNSFFKVILYRERKEKEYMILRIIKKKKEVTSKELSKYLGISERAVRNYLKNLLNRGIIGRKRVGRKIYYFLK